ncbi:MAG TPA: hypothetical protein VGO03_13840 [Acidimicrobiia bacterium]
MATITGTDGSVRDDVTLGRVGMVLLIAAPLAMAVGRALLVPLDDQRWNKMLTAMADHQSRSDFGWVLALASCGLLTLTVALFARQLNESGRTKTAWFCVIACALGWAGTASTCGAALLMSAAAKSPARAAMIKAVDDFNSGIGVALAFMLVLIAAIGYIVLAVGMTRAKTVSKGAAVIVAIGGVMTLVTMPGPKTVLLVLSALLLCVGHVLALRPPRAANEVHRRE